jgi:hypothetical protein
MAKKTSDRIKEDGVRRRVSLCGGGGFSSIQQPTERQQTLRPID